MESQKIIIVGAGLGQSYLARELAKKCVSATFITPKEAKEIVLDIPKEKLYLNTYANKLLNNKKYNYGKDRN